MIHLSPLELSNQPYNPLGAIEKQGGRSKLKFHSWKSHGLAVFAGRTSKACASLGQLQWIQPFTACNVHAL